ncbi:Acireductone dioxygenase ARD family [Mycena floridula]|nr:Acireductone dioxygenase ARD family [Mycena floridula]
MRAYYFDNVPGDQRLPHDSSRPVPPAILDSLKVEHQEIPVSDYETQVRAIAEERDYKSQDTVDVSREKLGQSYNEKMSVFYREHMHEDEEIRYVLEGGGFFDVREMPSDSWIRIAVVPGDLLVLPSGVYHRFTLDEADRIKMVRLFKDVPKWEAHNRSAESDNHPHRIAYLKAIMV